MMNVGHGKPRCHAGLSEAHHRGELLHDMSQMGGPVCTGTSVAEIPEKLACGDDKRGQQGAYTMAHVLVLALFWFPWLHRLGGVGTLENLHPRFFVGTDDEAPLLKATERMHIELTDIVCLGSEVGSVTVEPGDAPMGFEVGLLQAAPEAGATHGLRPRALLERY